MRHIRYAASERMSHADMHIKVQDLVNSHWFWSGLARGNKNRHGKI
jgi:hypothetical protein